MVSDSDVHHKMLSEQLCCMIKQQTERLHSTLNVAAAETVAVLNDGAWKCIFITPLLELSDGNFGQSSLAIRMNHYDQNHESSVVDSHVV